MKIKDGYMLREVAGNSVVVAIGKAALDFNGLITLNGSAAFFWKLLEKGAAEAELLAAILDEYDIDENQAKMDIAELIKRLKGSNLLD